MRIGNLRDLPQGSDRAACIVVGRVRFELVPVDVCAAGHSFERSLNGIRHAPLLSFILSASCSNARCSAIRAALGDGLPKAFASS